MALTEGLRANQKAITQGFNQFERLADMKELPDDPWEREWVPKRSPPGEEVDEEQQELLKNIRQDLEKNFDGNEIKILQEGNYPRPNKFSETNIQVLEEKLEDLNNDINKLNGIILGRRNNKDPSPEYAATTREMKETQRLLKKYKHYGIAPVDTRR